MEASTAKHWEPLLAPLPPPASDQSDVEQKIRDEMKDFNNFCTQWYHAKKGYTNPAKWWKKRETKMPNLARAVRALLAVPLTSAACERDFSASKALYAPNRRAMKPETLENLTIIRRRVKDDSERAAQKRKEAPVEVVEVPEHGNQ